MTQVYVVMADSGYDDYGTKPMLFSTRELAQDWLDKQSHAAWKELPAPSYSIEGVNIITEVEA